MTPSQRARYINILLGIVSALVVGLLIGGVEVGMTKPSFLIGLLVPVGMGFVASFWWGRAKVRSRDWIVLVPLTYLLHSILFLLRLPGDVRTSSAIIHLIMIPVFIPLIALGAMLGNRLFGLRVGTPIGAAGDDEPADHRTSHLP
jgi:hypothetical protein